MTEQNKNNNNNMDTDNEGTGVADGKQEAGRGRRYDRGYLRTQRQRKISKRIMEAGLYGVTAVAAGYWSKTAPVSKLRGRAECYAVTDGKQTYLTEDIMMN